MGRKVTVALTPAGNNFILGGKHTTFSAEDVYTVRSETVHLTRVLTRLAALDHPRLRQGCRVRLPQRATHGAEEVRQVRSLD